MAETAEEIREHIAVLTTFETKYGEFVRLLEDDRRSEYGPPKHTARLERLQREILESAPRADRAGKASGHWLTTTNPPAMGGGLRANGLTGQVMDIEEAGFMDDGLRIPRMILQTIPIQLGALRDVLAEAEKTTPSRAERPRDQPRRERSSADSEPDEGESVGDVGHRGRRERRLSGQSSRRKTTAPGTRTPGWWQSGVA